MKRSWIPHSRIPACHERTFALNLSVPAGRQIEEHDRKWLPRLNGVPAGRRPCPTGFVATSENPGDARQLAVIWAQSAADQIAF